MWENIDQATPDAIFGLTEQFNNDPNPDKINLGAGVYKDGNGQTPVLKVVKTAELHLLEHETTKSYLPISGHPGYAEGVQKLLFGDSNKAVVSKRAATSHAPGGTGALRMGAELLRKFISTACVWVSTPTWTNHKGIFRSVGFTVKDYPYYNPETKAVDIDRFLGCLEQVPMGDIVVLHACCHNPSGVDLSKDQWEMVVDIAKKRKWIPFIDFAYQGFGESIDEDRLAVELFSATGMDLFVASSFSKNLGLYNERAGALTVVSPTEREAQVAMSHLKSVIRTCYSNPPAHGGLVASAILGSQQLRELWIKELSEMRRRIVDMRTALVDGLSQRGVDIDFTYIKKQRGMFSFSGLSDDVVAWLKENKSIYVVDGGRINIAGLTADNLDVVCDSIAQAIVAVECARRNC